MAEAVDVAFAAELTAVVMASTALEVNVEAMVDIADLGILFAADQDEWPSWMRLRESIYKRGMYGKRNSYR